MRRRNFIAGLIGAAAATAALGQTVPSVVAPTPSGASKAAAVVDISGTWVYPLCCGFAPPLSGPGPVFNRVPRTQSYDADGRPLATPARPSPVSNLSQYIGDYDNPILRPQAGDIVKKHAEAELSGMSYPTPRNQCWPEGVPFIFSNMGIQVIQQPAEVTVLYEHDHQVRHVRMGEPHPARLTPSWYGDSVGRYEGDALVIDTVGIKIGRFSMIDWFGTPYTDALHVVERYRLIDYAAVQAGEELAATKNRRMPSHASGATGLAPAPGYKGKGLQLEFTVDDDGVFTMPWSATITYWRSFDEWPEHVCAENIQWHPRTYAELPTANRPDF